MYAVILAGGSGTRFWPLSRQKNPKQLMSVFGGKSMLQRTVERVLPLKPKRILVVTNALQAEESCPATQRVRQGVPDRHRRGTAGTEHRARHRACRLYRCALRPRWGDAAVLPARPLHRAREETVQ